MNDQLLIALSAVGAVAWTLITVRSIRRIGRGVPVTDGARILTVATLAVVATCLTYSVMGRATIAWVSVESARVAVDTARVVLALGGLLVLWAGRSAPPPVEDS